MTYFLFVYLLFWNWCQPSFRLSASWHWFSCWGPLQSRDAMKSVFLRAALLRRNRVTMSVQMSSMVAGTSARLTPVQPSVSEARKMPQPSMSGTAPLKKDAPLSLIKQTQHNQSLLDQTPSNRAVTNMWPSIVEISKNFVIIQDQLLEPPSSLPLEALLIRQLAFTEPTFKTTHNISRPTWMRVFMSLVINTMW